VDGVDFVDSVDVVDGGRWGRGNGGKKRRRRCSVPRARHLGRCAPPVSCCRAYWA